MSAKRQLINTGSSKRYVTRDAKGRFLTSVEVGRSLARDVRQAAKATVPKGYGHKGDQKRNP